MRRRSFLLVCFSVLPWSSATWRRIKEDGQEVVSVYRKREFAGRCRLNRCQDWGVRGMLRLRSLALLVRQNLGDTQVQVIGEVPRHGVGAAGRPAVPRRLVPATAANHAFRAPRRSPRIVRRRLRIIVLVVPVLAPLPHVAMHIIQSPRAGPLPAHRVRHPARIAVEPPVTPKARAPRVPWESRCGPN
jgi:hypothetical protein